MLKSENWEGTSETRVLVWTPQKQNTSIGTWRSKQTLRVEGAGVQKLGTWEPEMSQSTAQTRQGSRIQTSLSDNYHRRWSQGGNGDFYWDRLASRLKLREAAVHAWQDSATAGKDMAASKITSEPSLRWTRSWAIRSLSHIKNIKKQNQTSCTVARAGPWKRTKPGRKSRQPWASTAWREGQCRPAPPAARAERRQKPQLASGNGWRWVDAAEGRWCHR